LYELEKERKITYTLKKDLEKYKQDTSSLFKQISLIFATNLYVDRIKVFPVVNSVYLVQNDDIMDIWTFIEETDLNIEEKIAEAQCELMRIHRELDFDFMVIPRFGKNVNEYLPTDRTQIYPENKLVEFDGR